MLFFKNIFGIFRKPAPLGIRLHAAVGTADIVLSLSVFFLRLFSTSPPWAAVWAACLSAASIIIFLIPALGKNRNAAEISVSVYTNILLLPSAFLLSGGTDGSVPLYFIAALSVSYILLTGCKRFVLIPLFFVWYVLVMCFAFLFPEYVLPAGGRLFRFAGTVCGVTAASLFTGITAWVLVDDAHRKNEKIRELNKYLTNLSARDPLTNLFNRRHIMEILNTYLSLSAENSDLFSLLMIDIDFFKQVNDTYGHLTGDRALKKFSRTLTKTIRKTDIAGRYGGDEFLVIFPDTTSEEAVMIAEKIRTRVESAQLTKKQDIQITISGGVVSFIPGLTAEQLISFADKKLYKAKHLGRNRIVR